MAKKPYLKTKDGREFINTKDGIFEITGKRFEVEPMKSEEELREDRVVIRELNKALKKSFKKT